MSLSVILPNFIKVGPLAFGAIPLPNKQINKQASKQTDRLTERQKDRWMEVKTDTPLFAG